MTTKQLTGMRGVYLVAAELAKQGFIASPTSRSAMGADILATDQECKNTYSIQVKTNTTTFNFWLLSKNSKNLNSDTFIYVFVNLRDKKNLIEFFVVPSAVVSKKIHEEGKGKNTFYSFLHKDAEKYKDNWEILKHRQTCCIE